MSLLRRVNVMKQIYSVRGAHWNKDWKPGPVPTTQAQIDEASKKYNLFPEEYRVREDDGWGTGDYPDVPPISAESRDIFYPWDFPEYRRNFGEIIHPEAHLYSEDRYDCNMKPRFSIPHMLKWFLGTMGLSYLLYFLTNDCFLPAKPKQLGFTGQTHYKFPSSH